MCGVGRHVTLHYITYHGCQEVDDGSGAGCSCIPPRIFTNHTSGVTPTTLEWTLSVRGAGVYRRYTAAGGLR
ncbi:hypothetical protein GDO81_025231 [Engystomops pustulosus]|uniref:Uncharacterized protein n=1 Tax=Engystomops pustulosus TaxID=76066 RepID=A0AAV6Z744_ENGPU|nr:hypothetical protein GDO81_025231 [Engystomops pustulosus]